MKKIRSGGMDDAVTAVAKHVDRRVRGSSGETLKRLNIELPEDVHKELKLEAVMKGVSMRQLVEEMLQARYS